MAFLRWHRKSWRDRRPLAYAWWIGLESTIASLLVAIPVAMLLPPDAEEHPLAQLSKMKLVAAGLLIAPIVETLVLQWLPMTVVRRLGGGHGAQVAISVALFAAAHVPSGAVTVVAAGIVGGWYFATTYARWRPVSMWTALWTTALAHAIHNAIVIVPYVLLA